MFAFREIQPSDAQQLIDWRSSPRVSRFMNTDISGELAAQHRWIEDCYDKNHYYHWIVQLNQKDVGFVNFVDWDAAKGTVAWGFYIGDDSALGFGGMLPPFFYNFCFQHLGVTSVQAEVFYRNLDVIQLHLLHGYAFEPKRDHVITKRGKETLLVAMQLDKARFLNSRFAKYKAHFPLSHWRHKALLDATPPPVVNAAMR